MLAQREKSAPPKSNHQRQRQQQRPRALAPRPGAASSLSMRPPPPVRAARTRRLGHSPLIHSPICRRRLLPAHARATGVLGDHVEPVASSNSSSSSSLTTSAAQPARAAPELAADLRGGADVDAPGRLRDDQQLRVGVDSRPTMNFCRLPPDSDLSRRLRPARLDVEALDDPGRERSHAPRRIQPPRPTASRRVSSGSAPATAPAPRSGRGAPRERNAGRARAAARRREARGRPDLDRAGGARGSSPDTATISSCWPLPERRRCRPPRRPALRSRWRRGQGRTGPRQRQRQVTARRSTTSPGARAWRSSAGGSAPIINPRQRGVVSPARGSTMPDLAPRITVQLWHSARISSSLWLM